MPTLASLLVPLALAAPAAAPANVYALEDEAFLAQAQEDLALLERNAQGLRALRSRVTETRQLYRKSQRVPYTPDEKHVLLSTWAALFDYFVSTEVVRQRYWDFLQVNERKQPAKHAWGFLLTQGALALQLAHGLAYVDLAGGRKQLEVLLDEPSAELGLAPRAFARFKEKVVHVSSASQLVALEAYGRQLRPLFRKLRLVEQPRVRWIVEETLANVEGAKRKLARRGVSLFAKAGADIVHDAGKQAFFPVQRSVAEWMGDTRVRRQGRPLISREQVEAVLRELQPGDIVLARQNWYLSNIGLPGFWPHAELYLGTPADLAAHFDADEATRAWLATLPERPASFAALLSQRFPGKWTAYLEADEHGDARRIIESISEGVSFTGPEHGLRVDYLGVMRPRLSRVEKAKALLRAFEYQGRPYDFDFDFFSDATLVCTELVYKAYAPSSEMKGLSVPLVDVAGRRTLPANELVRLFDAERERPDRQLDFVAFLDGREAEQDAVRADEASFRQSFRRLKWDVAQR